jgi:RHS repeat-associated protein
MRGSVIDEVVNGYQLDSNNNMTNYSYYHDSLESVLGQSINTGSVAASQGYTSFGGTVNANGTSNNTLQYTGRENDTETGFYYYRARYYDPITGRFLSEDPIRSGINFYVYCGNNPVNCRDPYGLVNWQNLAFGVGDLTVSSAETLGGFSLMLFSPTGGPISPPVFYTGLAITAYGEVGMMNAGIDIKNALFESDDQGALESIGAAIGGQSGATLGQTADLFTQILPALSAAGALNGIKDVYNLSSGINASNNKFGKATTPSSSGVKSNNVNKTQSFSNSNNIKSNSSSNNIIPSALISATNAAMDSINSIIMPQAPIIVPSTAFNTPKATVEIGDPEPDTAANGGFILYPNMSNTNQVQSVYSKH